MMRKIQGEQVFAEGRIEFGQRELVVVPVLDRPADALALGLPVEPAVDVAVIVPPDLSPESRQFFQFLPVAPRVVGIRREVDVPPGPDPGEVREGVKVVSEPGGIVVGDKTPDDFFGCHRIPLPCGFGFSFPSRTPPVLSVRTCRRENGRSERLCDRHFNGRADRIRASKAVACIGITAILPFNLTVRSRGYRLIVRIQHRCAHDHAIVASVVIPRI